MLEKCKIAVAIERRNYNDFPSYATEVVDAFCYLGSYIAHRETVTFRISCENGQNVMTCLRVTEKHLKEQEFSLVWQ